PGEMAAGPASLARGAGEGDPGFTRLRFGIVCHGRPPRGVRLDPPGNREVVWSAFPASSAPDGRGVGERPGRHPHGGSWERENSARPSMTFLTLNNALHAFG